MYVLSDHLRKSKIEESSESKEGTEETLGVSLNEVSIVAHEVSLVRQRDEPPSFKHLFHAWCPWEQFDRDVRNTLIICTLTSPKTI